MGRESLAEIEFLVRSTCRVRILEALTERGALTSAELRREIGVVRTTVQRNLDALEERGLVHSVADGYEITLAGELVATDIGEMAETMAFIERAKAVLSQLTEADVPVDVDPHALVDATIVEATAANPYAPVESHLETLTTATHTRAVLPATSADALETARSAAESGTTAEIVLTDEVVETVQSTPALREHFESLADMENVTTYRYDGEVPYYLGVLDDAVQIGVHDEAGIPQALLESRDDDVREWAMERYEAYRADAEPLA